MSPEISDFEIINKDTRCLTDFVVNNHNHQSPRMWASGGESTVPLMPACCVLPLWPQNPAMLAGSPSFTGCEVHMPETPPKTEQSSKWSARVDTVWGGDRETVQAAHRLDHPSGRWQEQVSLVS